MTFSHEAHSINTQMIIIIILSTFDLQEDEEAEWRTIKPEAFAIIMDFFTSGLPVIHEGDRADDDHGKYNYQSVVS